MAKKAYIGVNNVARKIKKGYVGVNGVARKIKKAYVGIGGVARPCWSGGELAYYGTITELSYARRSLAATTVGDYALFAGGYGSSGTAYQVSVYNASLVRSLAESLPTGTDGYYAEDLAATTIGNYALFAGGYDTDGEDMKNYVKAYNSSLTTSIPSALTQSKCNLAATTVGNYALFGGGRLKRTGTSESAFSKVVNAYNKSLTRSTPTALSYTVAYLAATTVGGYALFGGGTNNNISNRVYAYDSSLTMTVATNLSVARQKLATTTVGDYALFAGGYSDSYFATVDVYDSSLTRTTAADLTTAKLNLAATTVGNYALFAGGTTGSNKYNAGVDIYDISLTKTTSNLSVSRDKLAATSVGNYALFAGGYSKASLIASAVYYDTVDAYIVA